MDNEPLRLLEGWKEDLERAWKKIPKRYRNEHTVRRTLQCYLFSRIGEKGYRLVADYMPPRVADRPVDLLVLDESQQPFAAICLDSVVTLSAVKSLTSFEVPYRVIYTLSPLEKKVQESRFFLKPEVIHHHVHTMELSLHAPG